MEELRFEIKRAEIALPSVSFRPLDQYPKIGLIDINIIAASTAEEIVAAVEELQSQGVEYFHPRPAGQRRRPAGCRDRDLKLFLEDGEIMYEQFKGEEPKVFKVDRERRAGGDPDCGADRSELSMASEIIAGALQVHDRGPLIGAPSYGKNTVQLVFTLEDNSSIHVTSAVWWLPGQSAEVDFQLIPDISAGEGE